MKQSSNAIQPGFVELASLPRSSSPQSLQVPEFYTEPPAKEKSTYATVAAEAKNQGLSTRERVGSSAAGGASSALGWSGEPEAAAPAVGDAVAGRRDVAESVACGFTRGDPATGPHAIGTVGGVVSTDAVGAGCACG
ncbi:hypothetical protein MRX96_028088 [Rhipicephalus microplus]